MRKLTLKIFGKVQGVFFRKHAKEVADSLGVVGWVMNEVDGSVLVEAEGSEGKLKEFLQWAKNGSQGAIVEKIDEGWDDKTVGYKDFEIRWNSKIIN